MIAVIVVALSLATIVLALRWLEDNGIRIQIRMLDPIPVRL
jgi:hypothetical protein